ncbi:sulfotransferase domain-containing protein [Ovoidimarina sediminis]|uniref:sulfotransferase domain-containing protein n=1 Tax=Ovoidimarina sediminis TaxID=3079856 RepID=UPI00290EF798|nr:sulfotransferase domain-containing protein [Rhodophyticola sp. MJ-SS7]MDU8944377.1 sulfotransferase domain-containing protein [Rhodophyticola sp. MJ-SS7]
MTTDLPRKTRDYEGPVTNTDMWDSFAFRPGDIVLSTPPKSGTTWSQAILMMLIHGAAITDRAVWHDAIWLDCAFRDRDAALAALAAQPHQRCIKSHTPFDGIAYDPRAIYIAVYRHPIDTYFSLKRHVANMKYDWLDHLFPDTPGAAFARFLNGPLTDQGTDDLTLASLINHYRSFKTWSHLPNVHLFHYADLKSDIRAAIRRYAAVIGTPAPEALVEAIAEATGIDQMRDITRHHARPAADSAFHDETSFFDSGSMNKWVGRLSQPEVDAYAARITASLPKGDRIWLESGTRP